MKDLSNLDLIRSVAVLLVVSSHLALVTGHAQPFGPWTGVAGVYIFFVHTSFVLMASLNRDPHPGRFYLRRAFRIYPLWLVVLALVLLTHLPASPLYAPSFRFYHPHWLELMFNILLLFDLRFGGQVVGASWSLPIELHMYLFLPFFFFFVRSTRKIWPLFVLDGFAMLLIATFPVPAPLLLVCVPCFFPGVISYFLAQRWRPLFPSWTFPLAFAVIVLAMTWLGRFKAAWFLTLALGLMLPLFRQLRARWLNRVTHLIARYSYGIYLGHLFAIVIAVHYLAGHSLALRVFAFFAVLVLLPMALYHTVEEPMIRLGSRLARLIETGPEPPVDERTLSLEPAP